MLADADQIERFECFFLFGGEIQRPNKPLVPLRCTATNMFSMTVRCGKTRVSWKVRPMPWLDLYRESGAQWVGL